MIIIIMNQLIDKFKIKTNNNLYNLNDIVTNVIKSKNVPLYINKIKNKKKILSQFYVDENEFISILNKGKSKSCKEALNLFNNTKDIPKNNLDLQNNLLSFNGYKFLYFSVNDDIWFKGKDIATILEYEKTRNAIDDHVLDEDKISFDGLKKRLSLSSNTKTLPTKSILPLKVKGSSLHPHTIFINESGLYSLIMSSKMQKAKEFKRWVTKEVLPSIRKTGTYTFKKDVKLLPDLNQYDKKSCFYLLNIRDNIYKYGISRDILNRITTHKRELNYEELLKIYTMIDDNKSALLETKIKRLAKQWNIACNYQNKTECFQTNNICKINDIINKIEDYRDEIISQDTDDVQLKIQREITRQKEYSLKEKEYSLKEKEYSLKEKELELLINLVNKYDGKYLEELVKKYINMSNHIKEESSIIKDDDTSSMTESKDTNVDMMNVDYDINKDDDTSSITESKDTNVDMMNVDNDINSNDTSSMTESKDTNMDMMNVDNDISHNDISQPMDIDQEHQLKSISETKSNVYKKKKVKKTKEKNVKKCIDCNIDVFRKSLRCLKCENKRRFEANMSGRPSNEQIRNDLQTMTFVAVGKKYGVSDNCIRKWLSKYERYNNLKS